MENTTMKGAVKAALAMKDKGPNTQEAKALAAKQAEQHKARMLEVSPVAVDIASAILDAEDKSESVWAMIRDARLSGFTWEELESVALKGKQFPQVPARGDGKVRAMNLKDLPAYRKAKQRIVKLAASDVELQPDMSSYEARNAVKTGAKGETNSDAAEDTVSVPAADRPHAFSDQTSVIKFAVALLIKDAKFRAAFPQEIREIARALANDEAAKKPAPVVTAPVQLQKAA